jgi:glycosyltransferase involved in cell wall biosynthesis
MSDERDERPKLRVGVLVDLALTDEAGGHVKCWERLAAAAVERGNGLDLSVHFLGDRDERKDLAPNVRYFLHRPILSTARLPFLKGTPDHTDLAPRHRGLRCHLGGYDVIHATDSYFSFARTALAFVRRYGGPLVSSTHTDTPKYARIFSREMVENLFGRGPIGRYLVDKVHVSERAGAYMEKMLDRYLRASAFVLTSSEADHRRALRLLPAARVRRLRRGVDTTFFHPRWRDRLAVNRRFDIPPDRALILFAGRVDSSKSPAVLAEAACRVRDRGVPIHVLFAGRGAEREAMRAALGADVSLPGPLSQKELRLLYASADLFVFPSTTELTPNVVVEAKASGLPVILSAQGGSGEMVARDGEDGILLDSTDPAGWAVAIEGLLADTERRRRMGLAARRHIETAWPSWADVLGEDLIPAWNQAAGRA